ncbi:MAG: NAD-dependent epimerase/dehydratase family protein [Chloroflexi bacterium]|nr:NAD-dependent epimerase/dehydratase family protein [Chloroflexota bacterium]MCI0576074.1 NAD-dependent epimerase/dehydratase family protein [Chloroflexota bacterium]MCI0647862.1 NAD-dependent epimerase/dehydratase family protein [Chloroflexota bacterium]MCI0727113.1 NAD-dependent epimerase/dehydratase family protein [Chloroflexota bacterium]
MRKKAILITGAAGEIGLALIEKLLAQDEARLLTLDLRPLPPETMGTVTHMEGDILDAALLARVVSEYELEAIYHLAALLSTRSEFSPEMAHRVNVDGTLRLMQLAADQSERRGQPVRFIFPSSIAAYGMPDLQTKAQAGRVKEGEWNYPATMYGCNKLYCELLGSYFSRHYQQLAARRPELIDFRCLRFPGLISAFTMPSGGTSDYAPEILHAAAKGEPYHCFVRPDTRIPFMVMPDAITALLTLAQAPAETLSRQVYNVTSFSPTAGEVRELVLRAFPEARIDYQPDHKRQGIVDSWPADLDDSAARQDWGWRPAYDIRRAFDDYLIPNIRRRYQV